MPLLCSFTMNFFNLKGIVMTTISKETNVHVYGSHADAENAIRTIAASGFDMKRLSIIGRGYHSEEYPVGFYTAGDRIRSWGGVGAFWGAVWGFLFAPAMFFLPGIGMVGLGGPIVAALIGALEGSIIVGGVSAIGAALSKVGVSDTQCIKYERALKADKFVLLVNGSAEELQKIDAVLLAGRKTIFL
jgi:hypothetical protein